MGKFKQKINTKVVIFLVVLIVLTALILFLRGPYVSNLLKMAVLTEISDMTGKQVIAKRIFINLLPLYVEARDVRAFNHEGTRLVSVSRFKVYPGLAALLRKELDLKRVVIYKPKVSMTRAEIEEILENIKRNREAAKRNRDTGMDTEGFDISVDSVIVRRGNVFFQDTEDNYSIAGSEIDAEVLLGDRTEVRFSMTSLSPVSEEWPRLDVEVEGNVLVAANRVDLRSFTVSQSGSSIHGIGYYAKGNKGNVKIDALLKGETIKSALGLERSGQGTLYARGDVSLDGDVKNPSLDLDLWGDFYLQSLIEAIGLGDYEHELSGHVNFRGQLEGPVRSMNGKAEATLNRGVIYGVEINQLSTPVDFRNNELAFPGAEATLYNGTATAVVSLPLLHMEDYDVDVAFDNVDSSPAIGLVGIDWLELSSGKVTGTFKTKGDGFNPEGEFDYHATGEGEGPWGLVRSARGTYRLRDDEDLLHLDVQASYDAVTTANFVGDVNTNTLDIDFTGRLRSGDVSGVTAIFVEGLSGAADINAVVSGTARSPQATAKVTMDKASFRGYEMGAVQGSVSYDEGVLMIKSLVALLPDRRHNAWGTIEFPLRDDLPDLADGEYDLSVRAEDGMLGSLLRAIGFQWDVDGRVDSKISLRGRGASPALSGSASAHDIVAYGWPVSGADIDFEFREKRFTLRRGSVTKGGSALDVEGFVTTDGEYSFSAGSKRLELTDLMGKGFPVSFAMNLDAEGMGTFDDPGLKMRLDILEGLFRDQPLGKGWVKGEIAGRKMDISASLVDDNLKMSSSVRFEEDLPWSAWLDVSPGRYDFLIAPFLTQIPEDMMLSMHGSIKATGNRDRLDARIVFGRLVINMFGQNFSNAGDVLVNIENDVVTFTSLTLQSGTAYLSAGGQIDIGASYDVTFEGSSELAPLLAFSDLFEGVRGHLDFVFSVQGTWDDPEPKGGLNLDRAAFGIKGYSQRLSDINASAFFDEGKVVVHEVHSTFGGGSLDASGALYLNNLRPDRFYLDTILNDVTLSPTRNLLVNLGGNVLFKGSLEQQALSGEIRINRAKYTQRLEWKSRLLGEGVPAAPEAEPGRLGKIGLNLRVYGDKNIEIDNNLTKASFNVDLIAKGTLADPRFYGRISTEEGKFYFRNHEFVISSATADYADDLAVRPYLRVAAETVTGGYNVWLSVEGETDRLDMSLSSDPPLEETDILALLAFGKTQSDEGGLEGGVGAAEAASFLTGEFQDVAEERVKTLTGLDRVQIDPYVSKTTGSVTPRVTVSKQLGDEDLYVTYSKPVGTDEQEIKLEYILSNNVSLEGGQDEVGSIGGDIKFRFRFK